MRQRPLWWDSSFDKVKRRVHCRIMALDETTIGVRLDRHHAQLLDGLTGLEQLGQSECIRRAIRHYCHSLGVEPKLPAKRKRKRSGRMAST